MGKHCKIDNITIKAIATDNRIHFLCQVRLELSQVNMLFSVAKISTHL